MPLKTLVKVGRITNLSDARYCAGMGVDFLGFAAVASQPEAITAKSYQEIRGWITGPQIVAEVYGINNEEELAVILDEFRPDYLELGSEEYNKIGSVIGLPFMLRLQEGEELPAMSIKPAYLLIDEDSTMTRFIPEHEVLLTIKDVEELNRALNHTGVSGICLHGQAELRPGLKHYDELADILEALEAE
ncbi:MAG TPA: hypothetical protein VD884_12520 [Ohtaekwangia sp.]|nr:hypothetical protein [Ohtaekwangia sp.]